MRCVKKSWDAELGVYQISCFHHKYTSTGYFDTEGQVWCGVLEGIEDSVIWSWTTPVEEDIESAFCELVHEYLSMCKNLKRVPQEPPFKELFEADSVVVAEVDGGGVRLYVDDAEDSNLVVSITNPVTGAVVESYNVKEVLVEENWDSETPEVTIRFHREDEDENNG